MGPPGSRLVTLVLEQAREINTLLVGADADELAAVEPVLVATAAHARARLAMEQAGRPAPEPVQEDRWLTPAEAAPMLRTSVRSLSRRWKNLPFCRPPITGRGFRVSLTGLREYMARPYDSEETRTRWRGRTTGPRP